MGTRSTMLDRVASNLAAVGGFVEWVGGTTPEELSTAQRVLADKVGFTIDMPSMGVGDGRQRKTTLAVETVVVGLLYHAQKSDNRTAMKLCLATEEIAIKAMLGSIPGWSVMLDGIERGDLTGGFKAIRITFSVSASVDWGA